MSDKFKQFKNELIDLCEKYNVLLDANQYYEICMSDEIRSYVIDAEIDKNTPKEDI